MLSRSIALDGLLPTGPRAVAVSLTINRTMLVILTAEHIASPAFQSPFDDQPARQFDQCRTPAGDARSVSNPVKGCIPT